VSPADVDLFLASLKRCLAQQPLFTSHFYDRFIASSEEVREKFRDTDMQRQVRMLEDSLFVVANAVQGTDGSMARGDLPRIAARHSRADLAIRPELYDQWAECLVATARECDPAFRPEIEESWRVVLAFGVEYMRDRY
jgi:hemoglobin-like flavoprotein